MTAIDASIITGAKDEILALIEAGKTLEAQERIGEIHAWTLRHVSQLDADFLIVWFDIALHRGQQ